MLLKNTSVVPTTYVMCPTFFSYSLPSGTCQCSSWGQTEWESDGRNQHWFPHCLCLFLFIPLGTLRFVCFVFFSSHFLPRNFTAACKGDNPALLAGNGSSGAPWKCQKLFAFQNVCLRKVSLHSLLWVLAVQMYFQHTGTKYLPIFSSRAPVLSSAHKLLSLQGRNGQWKSY